MPQGLQLQITGDASQAITALKKVVVEAKAAGKEVQKSFASGRLPLGDIKAYTASIQNLKQNLSQVTLTPLTQGISDAGGAAVSSTGKISGLISSLGRGGLVAVVGFSVGVLTDLIAKVLITGDSLKNITADFDRVNSSILEVNDSLNSLGGDLSFIKEFQHITAQIGGVKGTALALIDLAQQKKNDEILKDQIKEDLDNIEKQIENSLANINVLAKSQSITLEFNKQGLISENVVNEAGKITKKYFEIFNKLVSQRTDLNERLNKVNKDAILTDSKTSLEGIKQQEEANKKRTADYEKFVSDTISKAKELSSFLEKRNVLSFAEFEIDPRKTRDQNFEKAKKFIADALSGEFPFKLIVRPEIEFKKDFSAGAAFTNFSKQIEAVSAVLQKEVERLTKNNPILKLKAQIDVDAANALAKIEQNAQAVAALINATLTPAFNNMFQAIQAGENPLKAFFEGIGQAVLQLIQKLIQAAITAALLSAIFPGGVGGAKGFGAIFKGMFGFAGGGLVSGPTLGMIGEGSGTSLSNPEVIAPLDQLKSMLNDLGGSGRPQVVVLETRVKGDHLSLIHARTSRKHRRLGS